MDNNTYQKASVRTAPSSKQIMDTKMAFGTDFNVNLTHFSVGLSGESGEVLELVKKHVFYQKPLNKEKLIEELGDVCYYLSMLLTTLDTTFDEVFQANVDKLLKRYPNGSNNVDAIKRGDENEGN